MPQITADIEFEVYCGICGHGCCGDTTVSDGFRGHPRITVTCSNCAEQIEYLKQQIDDNEL